MADTDPIQKHIEAVCKDAGLQVMVQVYEIVCDREDTPARALLALTPDDVEDHYRAFVGPAVDRVERDLN